MKTAITRSFALLAIVAINMFLATQSQADPLTGRDLLKFSQLPMIQTPIVDTTGVVVGIYGGHDELSTAYGFPTAANPTPTQYDGRFMADDFADKLSTPVVHVKWWGSYLNDNNPVIPPQPKVKNFLIAFETDVPAPVPGFSRPGQVLQLDVVSSGALAPGSGTFTEKLIRGPDPILGESLYEYNAELHLNNAFFEQKDTVYWLKIAALVDAPLGIVFPPSNPPPGVTQWGWHNRDYTIQDTLASTGLPFPPGGEVIDGVVGANNVYHFQDDAVTGGLRYTTTSGIPNFGVFQPPQNMSPTNYMGGTDGPFTGQIPGQVGIDFHSKDLAFNLYTVQVPEPASAALVGCCLLIAAGRSVRRKR